MLPENLHTGNYDDKWEGEVQDVMNHPARNIPPVSKTEKGFEAIGPKHE